LVQVEGGDSRKGTNMGSAIGGAMQLGMDEENSEGRLLMLYVPLQHRQVAMLRLIPKRNTTRQAVLRQHRGKPQEVCLATFRPQMMKVRKVMFADPHSFCESVGPR